MISSVNQSFIEKGPSKGRILTGHKDADKVILANIEDDRDLLSMCLLDKYSFSLCDETFWLNRLKTKYPALLNFKKQYRYMHLSWKSYYLMMVKYIDLLNRKYGLQYLPSLFFDPRKTYLRLKANKKQLEEENPWSASEVFNFILAKETLKLLAENIKSIEDEEHMMNVLYTVKNGFGLDNMIDILATFVRIGRMDLFEKYNRIFTEQTNLQWDQYKQEFLLAAMISKNQELIEKIKAYNGINKFNFAEAFLKNLIILDDLQEFKKHEDTLKLKDGCNTYILFSMVAAEYGNYEFLKYLADKTIKMKCSSKDLVNALKMEIVYEKDIEKYIKLLKKQLKQ